MIIHIVSWNIWFGTYLDKIEDFLQSSRADVIGLQEVTQQPDGENNVGAQLASKLGYSYVYSVGMDLRPYGKQLVMGNAILSKYPILSSHIYTLSPKADSRVAIQADISISDTTLHIFSTHFLHTHQKPSVVQETQAKDLINVVPSTHAIIMGDFNATPDSVAIGLLENAFVKADGDSVSPTWSMYPEGCHVCLPQSVSVRLDYFFTTQDMRISNFRIEQSDGSDHLPLSLDVTL